MAKPKYTTPQDQITFSIINEDVLDRLIRDGEITLPQRKLSIPKDEQWNAKQMTSKILQGIQNGDAIPDIASSLMQVIGNNTVSAVRNARTMVTSAENHGRMDSYQNLENQGVVQKKVWIATADDRTRESHLELDGEEVDINDKFSNGCMFPADESCGDPSEVWNCRCSMRDHIIGFRRADGTISYINYGRDDTGHGAKIDEEKARRGIELKPNNPEVNDSGTNDQEIKENNIPEIHFVPAETIEEAERFANENFVRGGMNLTGKNISYKGIDIDVANHINERLNEIYSQYNIDQLSSLEAFGKNNKKIYSSNSDAPFFTTNFGNIGMNTTIIKSESAIEKYIADGENSFAYIMDNINVLSGSQLELARIYETAGRNLVDNSLEGMITHEIGHHISYMTNINRELSQLQTSDWKEYAKNLSGYANHSFGEYVAESWTAYYNGDIEKVQPELIKIFDGLKK